MNLHAHQLLLASQGEGYYTPVSFPFHARFDQSARERRVLKEQVELLTKALTDFRSETDSKLAALEKEVVNGNERLVTLLTTGKLPQKHGTKPKLQPPRPQQQQQQSEVVAAERGEDKEEKTEEGSHDKAVVVSAAEDSFESSVLLPELQQLRQQNETRLHQVEEKVDSITHTLSEGLQRVKSWIETNQVEADKKLANVFMLMASNYKKATTRTTPATMTGVASATTTSHFDGSDRDARLKTYYDIQHKTTNNPPAGSSTAAKTTIATATTTTTDTDTATTSPTDSLMDSPSPSPETYDPENAEEDLYRLQAKHPSLADLWDWWHGENKWDDGKGGVRGRDRAYRSNHWRKHYQADQYSKTKRVIRAIENLAAYNKQPVREAIASLEEPFQTLCHRNVSLFVQQCIRQNLLTPPGQKPRVKTKVIPSKRAALAITTIDEDEPMEDE